MPRNFVPYFLFRSGKTKKKFNVALVTVSPFCVSVAVNSTSNKACVETSGRASVDHWLSTVIALPVLAQNVSQPIPILPDYLVPLGTILGDGTHFPNESTSIRLFFFLSHLSITQRRTKIA